MSCQSNKYPRATLNKVIIIIIIIIILGIFLSWSYDLPNMVVTWKSWRDFQLDKHGQTANM